MNLFSYRCVVLAALLLICGCYRPYQNYGWQGQPGYYPPQPGQFQAPGQLVIPESNAPLSAPGTSPRDYEDEDDFGKPGSYYGGEDDVPPPQDSGGSGNRLDDDYPNTNGF